MSIYEQLASQYKQGINRSSLWPSGKGVLLQNDTWVRSPISCGNFSRSSGTSDLNIGIPVAIMPCVCRYRLRDGTGYTGVSIL